MNAFSSLLEHHRPDVYLVFIVRICACGIAITSLELLLRPRYLTDVGLMSWHISRLDHRWQLQGLTSAGLNAALRFPAFLWLLVMRFSVAALQTFGPAALILNPVILWLAAILTIAFTVRSRYGLNAADQVAILVFLGLAFVQVAPTQLTKTAYLWFLALQCCFSYTIAGIAKLSSAGWRNGTSLPGILCVKTYCHASVGRFVRQHPSILFAISWAVIVWECVFVLILILPIQYAAVFLGLGLCFHVITAIVMGLNDFVWAFCGMYPAVLFCLTLRN